MAWREPTDSKSPICGEFQRKHPEKLPRVNTFRVGPCCSQEDTENVPIPPPPPRAEVGTVPRPLRVQGRLVQETEAAPIFPFWDICFQPADLKSCGHVWRNEF